MPHLLPAAASAIAQAAPAAAAVAPEPAAVAATDDITVMSSAMPAAR